MEQPHVCHFCGETLNEDAIRRFDDHILCAPCFENRTVLCDCCQDRIWAEEAVGNATYTLCRDCYEDHFVVCHQCGALIPNDDARYWEEEDEAYCPDCYDKLSTDAIHSYHYKPAPIFYGGEGDSLFLGVELEIDEGGEDSGNAQQILDIGNRRDGHLYCKHDGSLENGFEIVSHPMTLSYHQNEMNWREVMAKAVDLGYTSHNAGSCGLHVHCNRSFFGDSYESQEEGIGRIVYLTERFWNELVKFSRRTPGSLNRWTAKYATISDTVMETYQKAKSRDMGRYVAINLTNFSTVEFRLFRGTLRYDTFLAALQLVDELCRTAVRKQDWDLESLSWSDFVRRIPRDEKPELIAYLKSRCLYVNEQAEEREEY